MDGKNQGKIRNLRENRRGGIPLSRTDRRQIQEAQQISLSHGFEHPPLPPVGARESSSASIKCFPAVWMSSKSHLCIFSVKFWILAVISFRFCWTVATSGRWSVSTVKEGGHICKNGSAGGQTLSQDVPKPLNASAYVCMIEPTESFGVLTAVLMRSVFTGFITQQWIKSLRLSREEEVMHFTFFCYLLPSCV